MLFWSANRPEFDPTRGPTTVYDTLISTAELARDLGRPDWVLFDVRYDLSDPGFGRRAYDAGHIPGAAFLDMNSDLAGPPGAGRGRHPLPDVDRLAATLGAHGVGRDMQVVAYDDAGGTWAARLWWLLRYLGHDAVAVLEGGLPRWEAEGHPVERSVPPRRSAATFVPALRDEMVATTTDVADALAAGSHVLVDSRAPDRFRGENETIDPVGGHIPGARNRFFRQNLAPDGGLLPPASLRREFGDVLEGRSASEAIVYCGSGITACANLLALEHAGLRGARLYAGSWSEWIADPSRPVEIE
jgi:thiosulfate/3-mercaptopyruvate sulfurtransferase